MRYNRDRKYAPRSPSRDQARDLRRDATVPERILWKSLRNRSLHGLKFRRQHPIGPYTADFYCPDARLVVEIDSRAHNGRYEHDRARDRYMAGLGIRVLRFMAADLTKQRRGVLQTIACVALERVEEREKQ